MHGAGPRRPRWADTHFSVKHKVHMQSIWFLGSRPGSESRFHQLPRAPYLGSSLIKHTSQLSNLQLKFLLLLIRLDSSEQPAIPEN